MRNATLPKPRGGRTVKAKERIAHIPPDSSAEFVTPPQLAKRLGISEDKVYAWIDSGQLRAVNLAEHPHSERARWRISQEAIEEFLASRENKPPAPEPPKPRRRRRAVSGKQYF